MKSEYKRYPNGKTEVTNLYFNPKGEIRKVDMEMNAVIVHLFPKVDDDGDIFYEPRITIACADEDMVDPLKALAGSLMK